MAQHNTTRLDADSHGSHNIHGRTKKAQRRRDLHCRMQVCLDSEYLDTVWCAMVITGLPSSLLHRGGTGATVWTRSSFNIVHNVFHWPRAPPPPPLPLPQGESGNISIWDYGGTSRVCCSCCCCWCCSPPFPFDLLPQTRVCKRVRKDKRLL